MTRSRSALIAAFVAVLAGVAVWTGACSDAKLPPPAAGHIRVYGIRKPGVPPTAEKVTEDIRVRVLLFDPDDAPPVASLVFFDHKSGQPLVSQDAREGDVIAVRDLHVRVARLWYGGRRENRAVDLEIVSGAAR